MRNAKSNQFPGNNRYDEGLGGASINLSVDSKNKESQSFIRVKPLAATQHVTEEGPNQFYSLFNYQVPQQQRTKTPSNNGGPPGIVYDTNDIGPPMPLKANIAMSQNSVAKVSVPRKFTDELSLSSSQDSRRPLGPGGRFSGMYPPTGGILKAKSLARHEKAIGSKLRVMARSRTESQQLFPIDDGSLPTSQQSVSGQLSVEVRLGSRGDSQNRSHPTSSPEEAGITATENIVMASALEEEDSAVLPQASSSNIDKASSPRRRSKNNPKHGSTALQQQSLSLHSLSVSTNNSSLHRSSLPMVSGPGSPSLRHGHSGPGVSDPESPTGRPNTGDCSITQVLAASVKDIEGRPAPPLPRRIVGCNSQLYQFKGAESMTTDSVRPKSGGFLSVVDDNMTSPSRSSFNMYQKHKLRGQLLSRSNKSVEEYHDYIERRKQLLARSAGEQLQLDVPGSHDLPTVFTDELENSIPGGRRGEYHIEIQARMPEVSHSLYGDSLTISSPSKDQQQNSSSKHHPQGLIDEHKTTLSVVDGPGIDDAVVDDVVPGGEFDASGDDEGAAASLDSRSEQQLSKNNNHSEIDGSEVAAENSVDVLINLQNSTEQFTTAEPDIGLHLAPTKRNHHRAKAGGGSPRKVAYVLSSNGSMSGGGSSSSSSVIGNNENEKKPISENESNKNYPNVKFDLKDQAPSHIPPPCNNDNDTSGSAQNSEEVTSHGAVKAGVSGVPASLCTLSVRGHEGEFTGSPLGGMRKSPTSPNLGAGILETENSVFSVLSDPFGPNFSSSSIVATNTPHPLYRLDPAIARCELATVAKATASNSLCNKDALNNALLTDHSKVFAEMQVRDQHEPTKKHQSAVANSRGEISGMLAPFQVHKRIMGWKLTSMRRRRDLVSLLDIANKREPSELIRGANLRTSSDRRNIVPQKIPPIKWLKSQLLPILNDEQQRHQKVHGGAYGRYSAYYKDSHMDLELDSTTIDMEQDFAYTLRDEEGGDNFKHHKSFEDYEAKKWFDALSPEEQYEIIECNNRQKSMRARQSSAWEKSVRRMVSARISFKTTAGLRCLVEEQQKNKKKKAALLAEAQDRKTSEASQLLPGQHLAFEEDQEHEDIGLLYNGTDADELEYQRLEQAKYEQLRVVRQQNGEAVPLREIVERGKKNNRANNNSSSRKSSSSRNGRSRGRSSRGDSRGLGDSSVGGIRQFNDSSLLDTSGSIEAVLNARESSVAIGSTKEGNGASFSGPYSSTLPISGMFDSSVARATYNATERRPRSPEQQLYDYPMNMQRTRDRIDILGTVGTRREVELHCNQSGKFTSTISGAKDACMEQQHVSSINQRELPLSSGCLSISNNDTNSDTINIQHLIDASKLSLEQRQDDNRRIDGDVDPKAKKGGEEEVTTDDHRRQYSRLPGQGTGLQIPRVTSIRGILPGEQEATNIEVVSNIGDCGTTAAQRRRSGSDAGVVFGDDDDNLSMGSVISLNEGLTRGAAGPASSASVSVKSTGDTGSFVSTGKSNAMVSKDGYVNRGNARGVGPSLATTGSVASLHANLSATSPIKDKSTSKVGANAAGSNPVWKLDEDDAHR